MRHRRARPTRSSILALIRLAHVLGLTVTAEWVETAAQCERLRRLGCDTGQGWYFSPAVEPDTIAELLRRPPSPPIEVRPATRARRRGARIGR